MRLTIARALIRDPRLLIVDEATSALDSITEEQIAATVRAVGAAAVSHSCHVCKRHSPRFQRQDKRR